MGGKRKILTQTRRTALKKEMQEALMNGTFTTNGRPVDEILDEINQGIVEGRYPIEVDLPTLINIWRGNPAPSEAPAPEPPPTNHGTVDQQLAAAQQNGHQAAVAPMVPSQQIPQEPYPVPQQIQGVPVNVHSGDTVNGMPAQQWQAQQVAQGYGPTAEQAAELGLPPGSPVVQQPSPLPAAAGVAPGMQVPTAFGQQPVLQVPAQAMTLQQAQAAMSTAESIEIGQPPKEEPVQVDASPVAEWLGLAKQAQAKIDALKDILEQAKGNAAAYADQVGGPDRSKVLLLNGQIAMRRTFVVKSTTDTKRLAAEHPEIDIEAYKNPTSYYRTELV